MVTKVSYAKVGQEESLGRLPKMTARKICKNLQETDRRSGVELVRVSASMDSGLKP